MTAEEVLRRVVVNKVTFNPTTAACPCSSLLLAVSEHLLPLQDHLVEFLQARLQALAIQRRAALCVVQRGRAELMEGQRLLYLKHSSMTEEVSDDKIHWISCKNHSYSRFVFRWHIHVI